MKQFVFLIATFALLSCNKEKSATMPLKANPTAVQTDIGGIRNSIAITLDASHSTGDIMQYGWALDITSPTDVGSNNPLSFVPSSSHKGSDFVAIGAIVVKPGTYVFGLTVYDKDNHQDYATVSINVK